MLPPTFMILLLRLRINRNIVECKLNNGMLTGFNGISINRNIVECKCVSGSSVYVNVAVLIETLWNVNLFSTAAMRLTSFRINRNIVECK